MAYNEGTRGFVAGGTVNPYRRVVAASGTVTQAGAAAQGIGVSLGYATSGEHVSVRLINCSGTQEIEASGAVTINAAVYASADGKVSALPAAAGTYYRVGTALEAASGDGAVIEVLCDDAVSTATVL